MSKANWGTDVEIEIRNRIQLSICAYAYEFMSVSLVSDTDFDVAAFAIRPNMATGNEKLDKFFREEFTPSTGMWIHKHPDINGIAARYNMLMRALGEPNDN